MHPLIQSLLIGILLVTTIASAQTKSANSRTISVCELFKDLRSHAGEIISVRGILYSGFEIYALGAHCQSKFVTTYNWAPVLLGLPETPTGEHAWPTALDLKYSVVERGEETVSFQTDEEALRRVNLVIHRELAKVGAHEETEVWVTVAGKLRMMDHYQVGKFPDGTIHGAGYGHLGMYPGQLIIKTIVDPVVAPKTKQEQ